MRQLRLVGVADDGGSLLLETPTGEAFRLPLDERLRAACRGDLTRLGQIEIELDNPLRPRDIQARVRAGQSAEEVAAASGMPLDRVLRFAAPMLQERQRVVAQARTTRPHPKREETLGELVEERLVGRGADAATLRWDAWRREDGQWTVLLAWRHSSGEHSASWTFRLAGRTLQPDDPAAEQLTAEEYHARTITAVTPLAVAARVPGRPGPPRPGGGGAGVPRPPERAAGGADARGAARPGAGRAAQTGPDRAAQGAAPDAPATASAPAGVTPADAGAAGTAEAAGTGTAGRATGTGAAAASGGTPPGAGRRSAGTARPGRRRAGAEPVGDDGGDEAGSPEAERRVAAGGETDPRSGAEGERARRPSVPAWDDILLGTRRRH